MVAARYSFLLAVPAVLASGFYERYVVIVAFLRYLARGTFTPFVVYRLAVAGLLIALVAAGVLEPSAAAATAGD